MLTLLGFVPCGAYPVVQTPTPRSPAAPAHRYLAASVLGVSKNTRAEVPLPRGASLHMWGTSKYSTASSSSQCTAAAGFAKRSAKALLYRPRSNSRRRDCHLMAPPFTFSRCFNRDKQGVSVK